MAKMMDWESFGPVNYGGLTDKEQMGVAFFISKGYTSGTVDVLHWKLEFKSLINIDDLKMVAEMIEQGYTSGHHPTWQLMFNRQSGLDREIEKAVREHAEEARLDLSEEQLKSALMGVLFWHNMTLSKAIADSLPASK